MLVCPTTTLLKFNEEGEIVRVGCIPVPVSVIARGEFEASLMTVRLPVTAPSEVGANWTCKVALWPTGTEVEAFAPTTVKPAPEMVTWEMFTVAVPVFVTLTLCVAELPVAMLPKLRLGALAERTPVLVVPGPPVPPVAAEVV